MKGPCCAICKVGSINCDGNGWNPFKNLLTCFWITSTASSTTAAPRYVSEWWKPSTATSKPFLEGAVVTRISAIYCSRPNAWRSPRPNSSFFRKPPKMRVSTNSCAEPTFLRNTLTLEKTRNPSSPRRCGCCGSGSVLLRGVAHDQSDDAAGQDDLEIVAVLHVRNQESQYEANRHTKQDSQRYGIHLSSKNARSNASYEPLDGGPDNDTRELDSHRRGEPRCRPVDRTQHGSEQKSQQHFVHHIPSSRFVSLVFFTTNPRIPLSLSVHKKQDRYPHHQIRCNQQDKEAVAPVKPSGLLKKTFPVGSDREPVQVPRNIQRELLDIGVAVRRRCRRRLRANGQQRFVETGRIRKGSYFWLAGEQESQHGTERIDVGARVQMFHIAARLFRRHVAGRAHHRAVRRHRGTLRRVIRIGPVLRFFQNRCVPIHRL